MDYQDGYYWFSGERTDKPAIVERCGGQWWCVNERGPITLEELARRGWTLECFALPPARLRA